MRSRDSNIKKENMTDKRGNNVFGDTLSRNIETRRQFDMRQKKERLEAELIKLKEDCREVLNILNEPSPIFPVFLVQYQNLHIWKGVQYSING